MIYSLISPIELPIVEQVFKNRGISKENIETYLRPPASVQHESELLDNIKAGVEMLWQHIELEDDILVVVDCDADGFTSSAVLINYLTRLVPSFVQNHITYYLHEDKTHGLADCFEEAEKFQLVILPDAGSNDYEWHSKLNEKNIDILIIDHHEAEYVSKDAVVINNQLCDYPNKTLSGVGVVYKFCQYMDKILNKDIAIDYLDLVAVGLIADMVDIRELETRYYISEGLANPRNPFILGMMEKNEFKIQGELSPFKVSFYIAPFINATIRSGGADDKRILFEAMLEINNEKMVDSTKRGCFGEQETLIDQVCRNCGNIKNRQDKLADQGLVQLEFIIEENKLLDNKVLLITLPDFSLDKNIVGLMANKLMGKYKRPVAVLNKTPEGWMGSARGYEKSQLKDFKDFLLASGIPTLAQGHQNAFGLCVPFEEFDDLVKYCNTALDGIDFTPSYKIDYINPTSSQILEVAELKSIWGQNIEEPLILLENLKIYKHNLQLLKRNTLKISIPDSDIEIIKFGSSEEEFRSLYSENGYVSINLIGRCSINEWNGSITPQIELVDYDIVSTQQYYF